MRIRIGLLFGGRSAEHDVSRMSAANVLRALDPSRYEVVPIGIGRDGRWRLCGGSNSAGISAAALEIPAVAPSVALIPGGEGKLVVLDAASPDAASNLRLDVVFPVLHGPNGEDGTIQGCLELARVPFVGSGVTGSAVGMDKDLGKRLLREAGIPVVPFLTMTDRCRVDYATAVRELDSAELFVKPANMGSSVGVSRVRDVDEYDRACWSAFRYDHKLLVEQGVANPREIECAVLEYPSGELHASPPGEIVPAAHHQFYSYDAKYIDPQGAALYAPAALPSATAERVMALAIAVFRALACEGLARVDFFVDSARPDQVFVNEVNTLPGFTEISMYPKVWEAAGVSQSELMEVLIAHALARHTRRGDPSRG